MANMSWLPNWRVTLLAAWLAGMLLALSRIGVMSWHLHRLVRGAAYIESGEVLHMAATLSALAGVRRLRLATASNLDSPIVMLGRVLVLPSWALQIKPDRLRAMLAHEVAHVARRDPTCKLGMALVCALLWFLPLTRIAVRRLDECAELACDAWAARVLGDGRALAECLADCLQRRADRASQPESFVLASAMADRKSPLVQRIECLLDDRNQGGSPVTTPSRTVSISFALTLLVVAVFALPAIGVNRAVADPASPANPELLVAPPTPAPPSVLPAVPPQPPASSVPPQPHPGPPAPPSPASPPEPPAFSADLLGTSMNSDVGNSQRSVVISFDDATRRFTASIHGRATFTDKADDIAGLDDGSTASFSETRGTTTRRIDYRGIDGGMERHYYVNGSEHPLDTDARAWIAKAIPLMLRDSGINAGPRVKYLHAQGGANAVLDEVDLIDSSYARGVYLRHLFAMGKLTSQQVTRVLGEIDDFDSDYERRTALSALLKVDPLDTAQQQLVIGQAAKIDSDYERAELLVDMLPLAGNQDLTNAWIDVAKAINSDYERRRTLDALVQGGSLDDATLERLLKAADSIGSDYEKRELLIAILTSSDDVNALAPRYANAVKKLGSDYEKRTAIEPLMRAGVLGKRAADAVLDVAESIGSDFERKQVLTGLARVMSDDASLIARYRGITRDMSDFERGEADRALDRFSRS